MNIFEQVPIFVNILISEQSESDRLTQIDIERKKVTSLWM